MSFNLLLSFAVIHINVASFGSSSSYFILDGEIKPEPNLLCLVYKLLQRLLTYSKLDKSVLYSICNSGRCCSINKLILQTFFVLCPRITLVFSSIGMRGIWTYKYTDKPPTHWRGHQGKSWPHHLLYHSTYPFVAWSSDTSFVLKLTKCSLSSANSVMFLSSYKTICIFLC